MTDAIGERRILDVDGYVHVVDGAIVCFDSYMFDLASRGAREALFREARKVRGSDGVRVLTDLGDESGNYMAETCRVGSLPAAVQDTIRGVRAGMR